jgi:hypothetical protein
VGYWENTTYVHHGSVADVASCLESLFAKEGMAPTETPLRRAHGGTSEPMQYADALHNDLWGIAVFPGAPSWTVAKTAPLELLGERRAGADRVRLAEACVALSVSAIQVNVYDSTGIVLAEVSPNGDLLLSGFNHLGPDIYAWHSERIEEANVIPQFRIHPLGDLPGDRLRSMNIARGLAKRLGGENEPFCDNSVSVDTLVTHKPLAARGSLVSYFRWQGPSRGARRAADSALPLAASTRGQRPE